MKRYRTILSDLYINQIEGYHLVVALRIFNVMIGNALAYHVGLALTLMGVGGGISLMIATTNFALIYLINRYSHEIQRILAR